MTEEQINKLSQKRRSKEIGQYFSANSYGPLPTPILKKNMDSDGALIPIDLDLHGTPFFVANLLKYKKHEWSVIAFIGNQRVKYLWIIICYFRWFGKHFRQ